MRKTFLALALWLLPFVVQAQQAPIVLTEGNRATYCMGATAQAAAGGAGDIAYVQGSATKAVRIVTAQVSGTATAAATTDGAWIKRTAAYTGGTFTALTANKMDTAADPTATAAPALVATATTPGAGGLLHTFKFQYGVTGTNAPAPIVDRFGVSNERAVVLRGTAEFFALNIAAIPAGASIDYSVCWVEE